MEKSIPMFVTLAGVLLFASAGLALGACHQEVAEKNSGPAKPGLQTVSQVDLQRYLGQWYEIATIPALFQKACVGGTTATYSLQKNGKVEVLNQCYTAGGQLKKAKGRAWIVDSATNAKLRVSFVPLLNISFLSGDYWIIDLGADYEYAVVGHPSRKFGWILSRTPEISEAALQGIRQRLEAQGYDFSKFKITDQKGFAGNPKP